METELIVMVILFSVGCGLLISDYLQRSKCQLRMDASNEGLRYLEASYKDTLEKINSIDTKRAEKLLELQDRIDKLDLCLRLVKK